MASSSNIRNVSNVTTQSKVYSLLEYLQREEKTLSKHEFYNGTLRRMPGAKYNHNLIAINVQRYIGNAIEAKEMDFILLNSDQKVYVERENAVLYPDALVIFEKPRFWKGRTDLILNPLVIVEVTSKSTKKYDWSDKFLLYQKIPSFREYVIIDQDKICVNTWFKKDKDTWKTSESTDKNGTVPLRALGLELPLDRVYRKVEF